MMECLLFRETVLLEELLSFGMVRRRRSSIRRSG